MNIYRKGFAWARRWHYRWLSAHVGSMHGRPQNYQPLLIHGCGSIVFGQNVHLGYEQSPDFWNSYIYFDLRGKGASIEIGDHVRLNNAASLTADGTYIRIGRKTIAGVHLSIETSDGHSLNAEQRHSTDFPRKPVVIGENVFLGDRVTILKGVTIGDNAIIGANSLVTRDIPANSIAAGNPCKVLNP